MNIYTLKTKSLFILFFVILSLFGFTKKIGAIEYFNDDFIDKDISKKWDIVGTGSWYVNDEKQLVSDVEAGGTSYFYAKNNDNLSDYIITSDATNISGVDQIFVFRVSSDKSQSYQVVFRFKDRFWPQDGGNIILRKYKNGRFLDLTDKMMDDFAGLDFSQGVTHRIKIVLVDANIKVYVDSVLIFDYTDYFRSGFWGAPLLTGGFGLRSWGGDYYYLSRNIFDNFRVVSKDHIDLPKHKIIILPGLGASWNTQAMVYNTNIPSDQWKMTPFVKNYDGLIQALEAKGLVRDQDFYVWNYDWRKPVGDIVSELNNFVNQKINNGEQVDLVGHSLGGLVARNWAQDNKDNPKLGKVITMASPHFGSISAYGAWNGGEVSDKFSFSSIALNVLIELQKKNKWNRLEAVRGFAPILKDLLPIFDFAKRNKKVIPVNDISVKNDYLLNKNQLTSSIFDKLKTITGVGQLTREWINFGDRNVFDKLLGLWPDGRPVGYSYTSNGDGTVLQKSAKFDGDSFETISSNHGDITDKSVETIFNELDLGSTVVPVTSINDIGDYLVFFMGSPADLSVKCDENDVVNADEMGFVVIKKDNLKNCKVSLVGNGNGVYHLVAGMSGNDNSWNYFENEIKIDESKELDFQVKNGDFMLSSNVGNQDFLYDLVKKDLEKLLEQDSFKTNKNLNNALGEVENKNSNKLLSYFFSFRKESKELLITNGIMDNLKNLIGLLNANSDLVNADKFYKKAIKDKSLIDSITRVNSRKGLEPSNFTANNYNKMVELLDNAEQSLKNKNYGKVVADSILASELSKQIW